MSRRTAAAAALIVAVSGVGAADPVLADTTSPASEIVVPLAQKPALRAGTGSWVGDRGFVLSMPDPAGTRYRWQSWDGRTQLDVPSHSLLLSIRYPDGREELVIQGSSLREFQTYDLGSAGGWVTHALPEGQELSYAAGGSQGRQLVTYTPRRDASGAVVGADLHLLTENGDTGTYSRRDVSGWPGGLPESPRGGDHNGMIVHYRPSGNGSQMALIDFGSAGVVWTGESQPQVLFDATRFGWYLYGKAHVLSRTDPSAPERTVTLPPAGGRATLFGDALLLVDDTALPGDQVTSPLYRVPLDGSAAEPVFSEANYVAFSPSTGGTLVRAGSEADMESWAWMRVREGADGEPELTTAAPISVDYAHRYGLSLVRGKLRYVEGVFASSGTPVLKRSIEDVGVAVQPVRGVYFPGSSLDPTANRCGPSTVCVPQVGGSYTYDPVTLYTGSDGVDRLKTGNDRVISMGGGGGRLLDVSERYALYESATGESQTVVDLSAGSVLETRAARPAAVWGDSRFSATATTGQVVIEDLKTGATSTIDTGAGCAFKEIQALGRWLYWSCGTKAGVYDRTGGKNIAVPVNEALLGDGYVATHDKAAGKLTLTDVTSGAPVTRTVADLPDGGAGVGRHVRWTVDRFGTNLAYVDAEERIHVVPSGVTPQNLTALAATPGGQITLPDSDEADRLIWSGYFSRPVASWSLSIRGKRSGELLRTLTGGATRAAAVVRWDGKDAAGRWAPDSAYTLTLTAGPADGQGPALVTTSTLTVRGNVARRDHSRRDGIGDLLAVTTSGDFTVYRGTGSGTFLSDAWGQPWSASIRPVPFGDLDGDRCNDFLVPLASGELRAYRPRCGWPFESSTAFVSLGTGWTAYNALTYPGDMTGDGRPDLLARGAKTGTLYLFPGTSGGKLGARRVVRTNWSGFTHIVGAGDLNGDGIGDVLARSTTGKLYRCYGRADGTLGSGVVLWSDWGASYKEVIGIGDITGDGRADLVSRDKYGNLYRNSGNGNGTFGGRVRIATGWQGYVRVF
ncbi:FG-GAP-like repeat-containing protein [Streptomyces sp. NPDC051940]|uniref:FG-GAP-like repeat-containing protein n=1 Tax=Streptomyces sp. NPDC051940 TaxID=3155675 RepID=UPI0034173890